MSAGSGHMDFAAATLSVIGVPGIRIYSSGPPAQIELAAGGGISVELF